MMTSTSCWLQHSCAILRETARRKHHASCALSSIAGLLYTFLTIYAYIAFARSRRSELEINCFRDKLLSTMHCFFQYSL